MANKFVSAGGAAFSSNKMDWETPQKLFDDLNKKYHFTLDPCSTDSNAKCELHFTERENGLAQDWSGNRVFCNPPYGREIAKWVEKAYTESQKGVFIVMLVPARTDTKWFHNFVYHKAKIEFLKGRLKFESNGVASQGAPFPSMLVIYNDKREVEINVNRD